MHTWPQSVLFLRPVVALALFVDPGMGLIDHFGHQRQVIPTEAGGILPLVAVLVEPTDGDVVPRSVLGFVLPDRGTDATEADLVDGRRFLGSSGHGSVLSYIEENE